MRPWVPAPKELWFPSLAWVKAVTAEFWSFAGHVEGQKCEPGTSGSPHPHSRPCRHRSNFTIVCYLTFVCNYSFWHKDLQRKLWEVLCELKVFLFVLIILQEPKNPVAHELLATLPRVWRAEVDFLQFSQCGWRLHLSAKGSRDKGRQGAYKHWEPQSWKKQSASSKPKAINKIVACRNPPQKKLQAWTQGTEKVFSLISVDIGQNWKGLQNCVKWINQKVRLVLCWNNKDYILKIRRTGQNVFQWANSSTIVCSPDEKINGSSSRTGNVVWSAEETFLEVVCPVSQWFYAIKGSWDLSSSKGFRKALKRGKTKVNVDSVLSND